jgi:uncharacterized membrane protein
MRIVSKRKCLQFALVSLLFVVSSTVSAAQRNGSGIVNAIARNDDNCSTYYPGSCINGGGWFTISGFTSAGDCPGYGGSGGNIFLGVHNTTAGKQLFDLAKISYVTGKSVIVYFDDTNKDPISGICYISALYAQ